MVNQTRLDVARCTGSSFRGPRSGNPESRSNLRKSRHVSDSGSPCGVRMTLSVPDHIAEAHPLPAVEALQLDLTDDVIICRAGVDPDAGQQKQQLQIPEVRGLRHDVLAGQLF